MRHAPLLLAIVVGLVVACGDDTPAPHGADDVAQSDDLRESDAETVDADSGSVADAVTSDSPGSDGTAAATVTYHGAVRPIIEVECASCHSAGNVAPFSLSSWDEVEPWRTAISAAVASGSMPPWPVDPSCRSVMDDRALSDEELATVAAWAEAGYPEGDPGEYVAPTVTDRRTLGEPDLLLAPAAPYSADRGRPDDYRCLLLDHRFDDETFVWASDVRPGERGVVHHVLLYVVPAEDVAAVQARDAADAEPGYACFGGTGGSGGPIAGWVPGMVPTTYPEGAAIVVPAGARIVMQVHYNTLALPPGEPAPADTTELALWTLPEGEVPTSRVDIVGVAQHDFRIPAGEPRVEVPRSFAIPWTAEIIGVAPHMHTLGTEIRGRVAHRTGEESCVVEIPEWDFNWQQFYRFSDDAQIRVRPGDTFEMECVYDNTPANQPVVNGQQVEPRDVRWGEGTLDEMCLIYLIAQTPYFVDDGTVCGGYDRCYRACDPGDSDCFLGCLPASGEACGGCVLDGYTDCITRECPAQGLALIQCVQACDDGTLGCLAGQCQPQFQAVYACIDPLARAGACNAELSACELEY